MVDVTGKEIRSIEIQSVNEKTQLDISDLPKGNYILKVISSGEVITNNFIKQ
ncbi:MAG: T9SS type A sorting domain-containing protein [Bacteroidetes bacterium]|nr:T9SS type A sorting domain-containing protein [Bacteroidota bacterium]